ncbi:MAG: hypothetical protein DRQ54_02700 [Gammaproteobacteria bacterium]|nr:MAG: hypothetical protein DRQ54_02700 [Gammaproteobacteria bacterium]RLA12944.1 MAG: hypothetical protein DRQ52_07150 [Gammaproteobacteria bacterium]
MPTTKSPVRQLAWDYYLGRVGPRYEYLRQRRLLVEAMISGKQVSASYEIDPTIPELEPNTPPETLMPHARAHIPPNQPTSPKKALSTRRHSLIFTLAFAVIAALSGATIYLGSDSKQSTTATPITATSTVNAN